MAHRTMPKFGQETEIKGMGRRNPKKAFFSFFSHLISTFSDISQSDASIGVKLKINISQLLSTFATGLPAS